MWKKSIFWCPGHPVDKAHRKLVLLTGQIPHLPAFNFADQLLTCVFIPAALWHFTADCTAKELQRAGQSLRALCCRRGHGPVKNRPLPLNNISACWQWGGQKQADRCGSVKDRRCELFGFHGRRLPGERDTPPRSNGFSVGFIRGLWNKQVWRAEGRSTHACVNGLPWAGSVVSEVEAHLRALYWVPLFSQSTQTQGDLSWL